MTGIQLLEALHKANMSVFSHAVTWIHLHDEQDPEWEIFIQIRKDTTKAMQDCEHMISMIREGSL